MSSSSGRRRFHVRRHPVVVDIGCSCRKPKLSSLLNFSLSRMTLSTKHGSSRSKGSSSSRDPFSPSASLTNTNTNTTTITNSSFSPSMGDTSSPSPSYVSPKKMKKMKKKMKKKKAVVEESVAVEKESSDPYLDFKDSMLQMIVEKEIYQWEDLRELLHLFLSLNSPYHHHLILRAFTEIWNGVFSPDQ